MLICNPLYIFFKHYNKLELIIKIIKIKNQMIVINLKVDTGFIKY